MMPSQLALLDNRHQQPDAHDRSSQETDDADQRNTEKQRRGLGDDDQGRADDQRGDDDRKGDAVADLVVGVQHALHAFELKHESKLLLADGARDLQQVLGKLLNEIHVLGENTHRVVAQALGRKT